MRAREFELLTRVVNHVAVRRVTPHADAARIHELCDCILDNFFSHRFTRIAYTDSVKICV